MIKKLLFIAFIFVSANVLAQTPVLNNFKILQGEEDKVYFEASGEDLSKLENLTKQGFIISGKTITVLNIIKDSPAGHSFTVSSAFTFWDNNTIRLENGDGTVDDFTLTYIINNLIEPNATTNRFVSATASGGNDGN